MSKAFNQNTVTKKFIESVDKLIDDGKIASRSALVDEIKWNKSSMSSVFNGRINVPSTVYKKFCDKYATDKAVTIPNGAELVVKKVLSIEAVSRVCLLALAELLAQQRGSSVVSVVSELEAAANRQLESQIKKS
jgi:hypothetical protein